MKDNRFQLPEKQGYDQAYELSYQLAAEEILKNVDIEQQCQKSDSEYRITESEKAIIIQFLNSSYKITLPDIQVLSMDSEEEVPLKEKLLILHYFNTAKGTPSNNKIITFRELPEGIVYYRTFSKRTIEPLLRTFGKEPQLLMDTGAKLGGYKADFGDAAVTINAFRRVPMTFIIWRGDDEFSPQGSVAFNANISDYLPTEDITVLCETITWKLIRSLR
jgi:hypothetical protein